VTFVPTGTTEASTSRVKIFGSFGFIKHLANQSLPVSSPQWRLKSTPFHVCGFQDADKTFPQ